MVWPKAPVVLGYGGPYLPNRQRPKFASPKYRLTKISPHLTMISWRTIHTKRPTARSPEALHMKALRIEALRTEVPRDALYDDLHDTLH